MRDGLHAGTNKSVSTARILRGVQLIHPLHTGNLPGNWSYEEISIGVPTGDVDWLRIVDTFVRQLTGSGESARLFKKYFGYEMPPL